MNVCINDITFSCVLFVSCGAGGVVGWVNNPQHYQQLQSAKAPSSTIAALGGNTGQEGGASTSSRVMASSASNKKKRKSPAGKGSDRDSTRRRLVKVNDLSREDERAIVHEISGDESGDSGSKPSRVAKTECLSKNNRIPRALIEKMSLPAGGATVSGSNEPAGSSVTSSSSAGVSVTAPDPDPAANKSADSILDTLGGPVERAGASSTKGHKGLKPDWLLKKEKVAEERERNKRFDTLQALGFSSKDPKAKLHGHSVPNLSTVSGEPMSAPDSPKKSAEVSG